MEHCEQIHNIQNILKRVFEFRFSIVMNIAAMRWFGTKEKSSQGTLRTLDIAIKIKRGVVEFNCIYQD